MGIFGTSASAGSLRPSESSATARLSVHLLGPVEVCLDDSPIRISTSGATALLAFLALWPRPHRREVIATALWPDGGTASAAWLRQALWQLRRALRSRDDGMIDADDDTIGLRASPDIEVDVWTFEAALRARPPRPERAVALYRGDLADGIELECFASDRERLNDLYEDALVELGSRCLAAGDTACALEAGLNLVARDPLREEGHTLLIEVYARDGSRSQVHRQYRRLRKTLAVELGVEPLPETQLSYERALARTWMRSEMRAGWHRPSVLANDGPPPERSAIRDAR